MAGWTCAACSTRNDLTNATCIACYGTKHAEPELPSWLAPPEPSARQSEPSRYSEPPLYPDPPRYSAPPEPAWGTPAWETPLREIPPPETPPSWGSVPPERTESPRPRRGRGPALVLFALLLVVLGGVFIATRSGDAEENANPPVSTMTARTATTTRTADPAPEPTTPEPTTPEPTTGPAGLVTIEQPGALAQRVAAMFETYFGGVNDGDPERALSVVEPRKNLNPSNPEHVAKFRSDISTTQDDEIRLGAVADRGATVSAELSFRSQQDPGYGPKGRPDETCTVWTMVYTLADGASGLRIRAVDAADEAC